jgi:hypothetical protein
VIKSNQNDVVHTTGTDKGRDVHITCAMRTTDKFPVSKLHPCKIGNWAFLKNPHVDVRLRTSFGASERSFTGGIVIALLPTFSSRSTESDKTFVRDHQLL